MDKILRWNVRGINSIRKQLEVKQYIQSTIGIIGLLETKVKSKNLGMLYQRMFNGWCFTSNSSLIDKGRILLAWKSTSFHLNICQCSEQYIHCFLTPVNAVKGFYVTFIYAYNERVKRLKLWEDLKKFKIIEPWLLCGDFNSILNTDERIGALVREAEMVDLTNCMLACGLHDIKSSGNYNTWNNKQEGVHRVFSEIDRMVANQAWQDDYPSAEASFHNEGEFDHTPVMLTIYPDNHGGKKPFKYFTMWRTSPKFLEIVGRIWSREIQGTKVFQVMKKLKAIKMELKMLNKEGYSDIQAVDMQAYKHKMSAQQQLHADPRKWGTLKRKYWYFKILK